MARGGSNAGELLSIEYLCAIMDAANPPKKRAISEDGAMNIAWSDVHQFAQNAEMWTSLAINAWIIISAMVFFIIPSNMTGDARLRTSILMSGLIVVVIVFILMFILELSLTSGASKTEQWVSGLFVGIGGLAGIGLIAGIIIGEIRYIKNKNSN